MNPPTKHSFIASLALACATVVTSAQQSLEPQGADFPKSPVLASRVSELPPPVVVYPGETLTLRTDRPHDPGFYGWVPMDPPDTGDPDVQWIEFGRWAEGHWRAFGGTLVSADERTVVFQAPVEAGVAFLEWSDGVREPICLAFVVPGSDIEWDTEVELPMEQLDGLDGSYLPAVGGSSFRVFVVHPCGMHLQNDRPCGEGFYYVSDMRLNPPLRDTECLSGTTNTYRYKAFLLPPSCDKRDYEGRVRVGGLEHEVYCERTGWTRHMHLWDCYECRAGQWVWCGNTVATWFTYHQSYDPSLVCTLPGYKCGPQQTQKEVFRTPGGCCPSLTGPTGGGRR